MFGTLGTSIARPDSLAHSLLAHLAFDALLFSAFLAGVKRTTGLTYVTHTHSISATQRPVSTGLPCLKYLIKISVVRALPFIRIPLDGIQK